MQLVTPAPTEHGDDMILRGVLNGLHPRDELALAVESKRGDVV